MVDKANNMQIMPTDRQTDRYSASMEQHSIRESSTSQTASEQRNAEYQQDVKREIPYARYECLIDVSMIGLDGHARVYRNVAPTIQSRDYKEPRLVVEGINERCRNA